MTTRAEVRLGAGLLEGRGQRRRRRGGSGVPARQQRRARRTWCGCSGRAPTRPCRRARRSSRRRTPSAADTARAPAGCVGHEAEVPERAGLAQQDRRVVFTAAVRAHAGGAGQGSERARRSRCSRDRRRRLQRCGWRRATRRGGRGRRGSRAPWRPPTTSALELDMPAARGRSLANARSAPSGAPGKFVASRRRGHLHVRAPSRCAARPGVCSREPQADVVLHVDDAQAAVVARRGGDARSRAAPPRRATSPPA